MPWFYISETPEASMSLFRLAFPDVEDIDIPFQNASLGDQKAIDAKDVDHLISLNQLDYGIYGYAISVQSARLAKITNKR
jgi:hypothetical protein